MALYLRNGPCSCERQGHSHPWENALQCEMYIITLNVMMYIYKKYFFLYHDDMEPEFDDPDLDRLETDPHFTAGHSQAIVRLYRMRMQQIRSAVDERDFYQLKSLHFEKLKGNREGQHSIRLNLQWRLIVQLRGNHPCKICAIVEIVDYH